MLPSTVNICLSVILFLAGIGCMIAAAVANYEMVVEVNRKLPSDRQLREYGWYFTRLVKAWALHQRFYPNSTLVRRIVVLSLLGMIFVFVAFWRIGLLP